MDFLERTNSNISIKFSYRGKHFLGDLEDRDIYNITLSRGKRRYSFKFGQSLHDSRIGKAPTPYHVLACIQKYDVGSFEDFCSEFGYDTDSKKAERIYHSVKKEYDSLCRLYTDEEMELLSEIC